MHGLVVKWNRELNNLNVISGERIYEKSVAAHVLTLMVDVPSAHLIRAVFSSYDAESETYKEMTEPLNMMESGVGQYELPIPDIVLAESGDRLITFMDYEPIVQGTETVYQVLTTGTVRIMVGANNAVLGQTPVPETVADQLQKEINNLYTRVRLIENVTVGKVMIDFKIEDNYVTKYYSDGTTATFPHNVYIPQTETSGNLTELVVPPSSWLRDNLEGRFFVAFAPETTGFHSNKFIALIEQYGKEIYEVGDETAPQERQGFFTLADGVFKGNDGSVLITANQPYMARVLLVNVGLAFVLRGGIGNGAIERNPYLVFENDDGESEEYYIETEALGEGAMALVEGAVAQGKRAIVFAKNGFAGKKAWDAFVVGQETESNASGNFTGGLNSKNFSPYGITYGKHCYTGVNAQNNEQVDNNGEPYKNSPAVNLGSHNVIMASNDDNEHAKVAIGDGLLVRAQSGRQAHGKYNANKDGVWFEFGGGYFDSANKQSVRKNVFDIKNNNTFRHYGDVTFARDAATAKGEVSFDITSVANGANIWLKFPKKSGTLALVEDVQGGGGKLYLHIIETHYTFAGDKTVYGGARVTLKLHYLSTSGTPYQTGSGLSAIPNFFKQQIGKVYYAQDNYDYRNWYVMFNEPYSGMETRVIAVNYRGEVQDGGYENDNHGDSLLDCIVDSDTVIEL